MYRLYRSKKISFRSYNLLVEVVSLALAVLFALAGTYLVLNEMSRRYIDLRADMVAQMPEFLEERISGARRALQAFADAGHIEGVTTPNTLLLQDISDIYLTDADAKIETLIKTSPQSPLAVGDSLASTGLRSFLASGRNVADRTWVSLAPQGSSASLFVAVPAREPDGRVSTSNFYIARMANEAVRDFLSQSYRVTGRPSYLVMPTGQVILSPVGVSTPDFFPLRDWEVDAGARSVELGNERWVPVVSMMHTADLRVVTLIPVRLMTVERQTVVIFIGLFLLGLLVLSVLRNRRMNRYVYQPIAEFSRQMGALEAEQRDTNGGVGAWAEGDFRKEDYQTPHRELSHEETHLALEDDEEEPTIRASVGSVRANQGSANQERLFSESRFQELFHLQLRFDAMSKAIAERERKILFYAEQLKNLNARLALVATTDGLTGIANRRRFDEVLATELVRLRRSNVPLSLMLLDIDYFKRFNDEYGHVAGDDCLRRIGALLASSISRASDTVARYGGEEFAAILPFTNERGAAALAECFRSGIESLGIPHTGSTVSAFVTVSIGVVTLSAGMGSVAGVVELADAQLYQAKRMGRNRVVAQTVGANPQQYADHQQFDTKLQ
ncbi:Hypothetical protein HDN1F_27200 [gamma proteobacterium HdN1]|nr:Hypothetical protein HDN1F_27200 [gamma proteobacterium HdN1]